MDNGTGDGLSEYEILMQALADPALADKLAQMGVYGDQMGLAGQQAKRADALRATPGAEGRTVGPHSVYVASSPLEHLSGALQRGRGERDLASATKAQQGLIAGDVDARKDLAQRMVTARADAMRRRAQAQQPPAPVPGPAAAGASGFDATSGFDDPANYG